MDSSRLSTFRASWMRPVMANLRDIDDRLCLPVAELGI
jgi:hypothetical protein